ncbi:hypothetical protein [Campylobacter jejuni]|uniref:hypothetical protein n=1 Tax=Campylobacter jejuni TaxID=197 RepID=UPI00092F37A4|nr:hypothetical protein [Campylobacter jejuni]
MTREQAELIIKEEKLIDTDWYPSYKHSGEYHLTMWFDSEKLEVIWYDEALKPLCAGIKHDKQRDKYISFITNAKAKIIEYRSIEFDGDRYSETFERMLNDESIALYALINRARMIKQNRISFV